MSARVIEENLEEIARKARAHVIKMAWGAGGAHVGGSLSLIDILTVLYFRAMRVDPARPDWEERDRLVLSKGHGGAALYAILAMKGFFPEEALFKSFNRVDGMLQEHPDMRLTPGVDMTTGSLGQGLSSAAGMAWGLRNRGLTGMVYAILGCGEMQEGQVWEAAMSAAHYGLSKLVAIIDYNGLQVNGPLDKLMAIEPLADKWTAFGWDVLEIDGHDLAQIERAIGEIVSRADSSPKPSALIAHTVKGKGVSFMEGRHEFHAATLNERDYIAAMRELGEEVRV